MAAAWPDSTGRIHPTTSELAIYWQQTRMQSVLWTLYIVGVTVIVASPLPFPQLRSNHERPQGSKDDDGGMGPPTREILKDLSLISAGAIGTKFFYDTRPKIPPDDSGSDTARSRNGPPAENRPTKSGMIGFDLDKVPFHDGDEWGQKFRKTMTPGEIWKWEKCVERHVRRYPSHQPCRYKDLY